MPRAVVDSEALSLGIYCSRFGLALVRRLSVQNHLIFWYKISFRYSHTLPYSLRSTVE